MGSMSDLPEAGLIALAEYIADSPPKEHGGFSKAAIDNAKAALEFYRSNHGGKSADKWQAEAERFEHLHRLDHSLADQWQDKNEKLMALAKTLAEALEPFAELAEEFTGTTVPECLRLIVYSDNAKGAKAALTEAREARVIE